MSDLHKQFLDKIKKQERKSGLALLREDGDEGSESESESEGLSPVSITTTWSRTDINHYNIYDEYETNISLIFRKYTLEVDNITFQTYYKECDASNVLFIFNHGGGSSAMTFYKLAEQLKDYSILLYDIRGHGCSTGGEFGYSLEKLTSDFEDVLEASNYTYNFISKEIYLVGHSLGGAILTNYLHNNPTTEFDIKGLAMLDIVEETAVASLSTMSTFIEKIPKLFVTYQQAIDWHIRIARILRNPESAYMSIPDLFIDDGDKLEWRTNLADTQPDWDTWFPHLSQHFVTCGHHVSKILLLAGHEELDKDLMIGQMQGKFQLVIFNNTNTGHFLHEDAPDQVAQTLIDFVKRNNPEEYMKQEMGIVPKWGGKIHS